MKGKQAVPAGGAHGQQRTLCMSDHVSVDMCMMRRASHTVAIVINAIVGDLSSVDPHVGCQVWVVDLDPRVDDAHRYIAGANRLLVPITRGLHQVQVVEAVPVWGVSIMCLHLVVQGGIGNICTTPMYSFPMQLLHAGTHG